AVAALRARHALKTPVRANSSPALRTPLTAVITHAELVRDGMPGASNDRQHGSLRGIIAGGRQLLDQVGEILTYARGAADQLTLSQSLFDAADVVAQVTQLNESLLSKRQLKLDVDVPRTLPQLHADREKVAHVLG